MKAERSGADYLVDKALRVTGESKLVRFKLQAADLDTGEVAAYACVDFGQTHVIDNKGRDVTPVKRIDQQTSLAKFIWSGKRLALSENSAWSGQSLC
ncbi:hypothetical protein [uncultured Amnibacterium sp.]|uniref:hypothetical protein n=1 Tax=uncultured Amnibacterium sp. TaxID=1631851 RepID=UPI0035CAD0EC